MTRELTIESVLRPPKFAPPSPAAVSLDAHPSDSRLLAVTYDSVNSSSSVHNSSANCPQTPSIDGSRLGVVNAQDCSQSDRLSVSSAVRSGVSLYGDCNERDCNGCVAVWTRDRPSSPLESLSFRDSRVTTVLWVPDDPNMLVGGTRDGHVAVWDLRVGGSPCQVGPGKAAWRAADGRGVTSLAAGGGTSGGEGGGGRVVAGRSGEEVMSGSAAGRMMRWSRRMMDMPLEVTRLTPPGVSPDSWRMLTQWPLVPTELQLSTAPDRTAPGNSPETTAGVSPGVFYMGTDCGGVFQGSLSPSPLTSSSSALHSSSFSSPSAQSKLGFKFGSSPPSARATSAATSSPALPASAFMSDPHHSDFISGLHCYPNPSALSSQPPLWLSSLASSSSHSSSSCPTPIPSTDHHSTTDGYTTSSSSWATHHHGNTPLEYYSSSSSSYFPGTAARQRNTGCYPSTSRHRSRDNCANGMNGVGGERGDGDGAEWEERGAALPWHGDLILSCSWDWTVKLWSSALPERPLLTLQSFGDTCHDVQWRPTSLSCFAVSVGSGRIELWDLASSTRCPTAAVTSTVNSGMSATVNNAVLKGQIISSTPAVESNHAGSDALSGQNMNGVSSSEVDGRSKPYMKDEGVFIRLRWACDGNAIIAGDTSGRISIIDVL